MTNHFNAKADPDRHYIWQRLIIADSEAFAKGDWSMIEKDFDEESFEGIRCYNFARPDDWQIAFPNVDSYRDSWLKASKEFVDANPDPLPTLLSRCRLTEIEINGTRALAHKKFTYSHRQTLYRLRKINRKWKIVGFLGFLPLNQK